MVSINLISWREPTRLYQEKWTKKICFFVFISSIILIYFCHYFLSHYLQRLQNRVHELAEKVQELRWQINQQIAKETTSQARSESSNNDEIASFLPTLEQLQANMNYFFREFSHAYDARVCFHDIKFTGKTILFSGYVHNAAELTKFLSSWQTGNLFDEIILDELKELDYQIMQFRFHATTQQSVASLIEREHSE